MASCQDNKSLLSVASQISAPLRWLLPMTLINDSNFTSEAIRKNHRMLFHFAISLRSVVVKLIHERFVLQPTMIHSANDVSIKLT